MKYIKNSSLLAALIFGLCLSTCKVQANPDDDVAIERAAKQLQKQIDAERDAAEKRYDESHKQPSEFGFGALVILAAPCLLFYSIYKGLKKDKSGKAMSEDIIYCPETIKYGIATSENIIHRAKTIKSRKAISEILIDCPHCEQRMQGEDGYRGMQINCPSCNNLFLVPLETGQEAQRKQLETYIEKPIPSVEKSKPEKQRKAGQGKDEVEKVNQAMKEGVPLTFYNAIATDAAKEWPGDYKMQVYVIKTQLEAYKQLHQ